MLGIKYVVYHLLYVVKFVCSGYYIGLRLTSISPHFSKKRWLGVGYPLNMLISDFPMLVFLII